MHDSDAEQCICVINVWRINRVRLGLRFSVIGLFKWIGIIACRMRYLRVRFRMTTDVKFRQQQQLNAILLVVVVVYNYGAVVLSHHRESVLEDWIIIVIISVHHTHIHTHMCTFSSCSPSTCFVWFTKHSSSNAHMAYASLSGIIQIQTHTHTSRFSVLVPFRTYFHPSQTLTHTHTHELIPPWIILYCSVEKQRQHNDLLWPSE